MDKEKFLSYIEYRDRDFDEPKIDERVEEWKYVRNM